MVEGYSNKRQGICCKKEGSGRIKGGARAWHGTAGGGVGRHKCRQGIAGEQNRHM